MSGVVILALDLRKLYAFLIEKCAKTIIYG
jgi:hypothetical protein